MVKFLMIFCLPWSGLSCDGYTYIWDVVLLGVIFSRSWLEPGPSCPGPCRCLVETLSCLCSLQLELSRPRPVLPRPVLPRPVLPRPVLPRPVQVSSWDIVVLMFFAVGIGTTLASADHSRLRAHNRVAGDLWWRWPWPRDDLWQRPSCTEWTQVQTVFNISSQSIQSGYFHCSMFLYYFHNKDSLSSLLYIV